MWRQVEGGRFESSWNQSLLSIPPDRSPVFNAGWVFTGAFPAALLLVHLPVLPPTCTPLGLSLPPPLPLLAWFLLLPPFFLVSPPAHKPAQLEELEPVFQKA